MTPKKWWHFVILFVVVSVFAATALTALAISLIYPTLPSLDTLSNYNPKQPLRVYSADNYLIGEFGEERRAFIKINDVPQDLKDAVLAIEDRRFYEHHGIDTTGVLRAIKNNVTGRAHEGASTITMQVAKNFFTVPGRKRTMTIKIKEALLAVKIEKTFTKDEILELYLNQIYLGQRSFGFAAASQVYYGKPLNKLTLAECALLAGLPKAPSTYNPYINPRRASQRQHDVLRDMHRYGMISDARYNEAMQQPIKLKTANKKLARELSADYVAELVRQMMYERYQDGIYSSGLKVYTTILRANQEAANQSVLQGILDYQKRQGYQKAEKVIDLSKLQSADFETGLQAELDDIDTYGGMMPAIVTEASAKVVKVFAKNGEKLEITGPGMSLVQKSLADKDPTNDKIKLGSVVRIIKSQNQWYILQLPEVESALVSLDPNNGAVTALVGGFDFNRSKFNHVTQAWRQPGSSFKPFIYSAALEKGFTPASIVEDEPITISASENGSNKTWEPKNFDSHYDGPIRLRTALTKSKNMVSIRVLQSIGARYAQDYITKFGFSRKDHPAYLTMALGAGQTTPWNLATGYAVFANGGFKIEPHIINKITDSNGNIIEEKKYPRARETAPRVIDSRNAFLMTSMMHDVVQMGTATRAKALGRQDLAGKTGTTNNQLDAWFAGFTPGQVAVAWIGYDQPHSLGKDETGAKAALPIWIQYMGVALQGSPDVPYSVPDGVMSVKIDPTTGTLTEEDDVNGVYEYFYQENPPPRVETVLPPLQEPSDAEFPPDSMINNPLSPPPERQRIDDALPRASRDERPPPDNGANSAARLLNPTSQ